MRKVFGFLLSNWFSRAYLLLVALVAVVVLVLLQMPTEGANLAGVWLILVTLPGSLLAAPIAALAPGWLGTVIFFVVFVASALLNAAMISFVVHAVQGRRRSRA